MDLEEADCYRHPYVATWALSVAFTQTLYVWCLPCLFNSFHLFLWRIPICHSFVHICCSHIPFPIPHATALIVAVTPSHVYCCWRFVDSTFGSSYPGGTFYNTDFYFYFWLLLFPHCHTFTFTFAGRLFTVHLNDLPLPTLWAVTTCSTPSMAWTLSRHYHIPILCAFCSSGFVTMLEYMGSTFTTLCCVRSRSTRTLV